MKKIKKEKEGLNMKVEEYLRLPYTIEVLRDDDKDNPGWVAHVVEFPGCITQADTFEELGEMLEDAMRAWIEVSQQEGHPIPEPREKESFSGKFVVRLPKSLHRLLAERAEKENVSLNMLVNTYLASAVSRETHLSKDNLSMQHPQHSLIAGQTEVGALLAIPQSDMTGIR